MSDPVRQLVVCCDGTNNNLTGRHSDTNVVKFCELLADDPDPRRLVYYDPGVGHAEEAPPTQLIERAQQWLQRATALAFGRGIYENIAEGYLFLMAHYRPGDEIYLFGFSRGAFTARSIGGLVNQFGLLAPHLAPLVPTLVALYFADRRPARHGLRSTRETASVQARRLFALPDRREVPVHFTGVWDTVAAVGMKPFQARFTAKPDLEGKHFVHVRQALSLDELRAQFAPRLYLGGNGRHEAALHRQGSLVQLWFSGDHCDVGSGHLRGESALSDEALHWLVGEALGCGLRLSHQGQPLRTEDEVARAVGALGLSLPAGANRVHRQMRVNRLWAVTGLTVRDAHEVRWDGHTEPHDPVEHPSVARRAATLAEFSVRRQPILGLLAGGMLALSFLAMGQVLAGYVPQGSLLDDLRQTLAQLGHYAQRVLDFLAWQLSAWRHLDLDTATLQGFAAPRTALVLDLVFIAAYAWLLAGPVAWAFVRLAGRRRATDGPPSRVLQALGWALPLLVGGDLIEDALGWAAITLKGSLMGADLAWLLAVAMALAFVVKLVAGAGVLVLVAWGALRPARRPAETAAGGTGQPTGHVR